MKANIPHLVPFSIFYAVLTAFHILASSYGDIQPLPYFTKPLLMFSLGIFFYQVAPKPLEALGKLVLLALFLSWLGDVLLMFQNYEQLYFLLGLISFLLAHICYVFAFTKTPKTAKSSWKPSLLATIVYLLIGFVSISYLKAGLGAMLIPVIVYSLTIILMNIMAVNRLDKVNTTSFWWVLIGAVSFLISDSILAINKFHSPIAAASFWIMATYCFGQYAIAVGILKQLEENKIPKI